MFGNTAYVYIGAAARIAFTLGLHSEGDVSSTNSLARQADLRLFCTLYNLDLDTALFYGHPLAINEDIIPGMLHIPCEEVLSSHFLSAYSIVQTHTPHPQCGPILYSLFSLIRS
jgi:hypothetical protein